jgi:hypothetical protein
LAQVDGLRVAGRTSSFSLKGKNTKEVGEKLNVGNVLEGSLQRQGNRVRVTAELTEARNGFHVWTGTYDREVDGAFALQDEIARSIVDALKIKFGVQLSAREQPGRVSVLEQSDGVATHKQSGNRIYEDYLQRLFTDVTPLTGVSSVGNSMPVQNPPNPLTVSNYTSPKSFDARRPDTRTTVAPPDTGVTINVRARPLEAGLRTNRITADVAGAPPGDKSTSSVRARPLEAALRANKVTADGLASIQGFVKDPKGGPVKGADLRIESRDGKQLFSTIKTDPNGRYISQGLQPGVYRVTLLVNGAVKASITNTRTKVNQPTHLNFDFKTTSQASKTAKGGKHMTWVPGRTGTHLGGTWVEVDDKGKADSGSNIQTVTAESW